MIQLFESGGQIIGALASVSISHTNKVERNIQVWYTFLTTDECCLAKYSI